MDYVNGIIRELCKPENVDLMVRVCSVDDHEGANGSFMWGFEQVGELSFDDFAAFEHQCDAVFGAELNLPEDLRSMSERYDDYLSRLHNRNSSVPLDENVP